MQELIERLEKAEGPSIDIDWHIYRFLTPKDEQSWVRPPAYTSSIDDALTLLPAGCVLETLSQGTDEPSTWRVILWHLKQLIGKNPQTRHRAKHRTPAIAICIAALRARMQKESE